MDEQKFKKVNSRERLPKLAKGVSVSSLNTTNLTRASNLQSDMFFVKIRNV